MSMNSCFTCRKPQSELTTPLQKCGGCHNPFYCSKECQKTDWKSHKKTCGTESSTKFVPLNSHSNPSAPNAKPSLLSLGAPQPLHGLSQADVFCLLVDCFRMRVEDEYTFRGNNMGSMNPFEGSPCVQDFAKFLNLAESKIGFLPTWWSPEKRRLCEEFSIRTMLGEYKYHGHAEGNITQPTEKADIQEHYDDNTMPMKLRMLAERVYGTSVMRS